jgi:ketosteroid isomerase-like protein
MPITAEQTKDLVEGAVEAAAAGDIEPFFSILHPEVEVHEPGYLPYGGHHRGRDAITRVFADAAKVVDFSSLRVNSVIADERHAAVLETVRLLESQKEITLSEHWVLDGDGLVREIRVFWSDVPTADD